MKFYVTGRTSNQSEVEKAVQLIKDRGHEITFEWSDRSLPSAKPFAENPELAGEYASKAISGAAEADAYVMLAHKDGNGVFAELGAALGAKGRKETMRIFAVGKQEETLLHWHPAIEWRTSVEEILDELEPVS